MERSFGGREWLARGRAARWLTGAVVPRQDAPGTRHEPPVTYGPNVKAKSL
jgi:hypothetical protein